MRELILSFLLLGFSACAQTATEAPEHPSAPEDPGYKAALIGTWYLSLAEMNMGGPMEMDSANSEVITYRADGTYTLRDYRMPELSGSGRYYVLENPGRSAPTIVGVPDLRIQEGDTIRPHYPIHDLLSISEKSFTVAYPTAVVQLGTDPKKFVTRRFVFTRVE